MAARHRILPPFYFLGCVIASALLHRYLPLVEVVPSPIHWAGTVLVVAGVSIALWASVLFKLAGTPVVPFTRSTAVVSTGIYRWTRNPMYLGMVIGLLGIAMLLGSLGAFLPIPFFFWQIRRKFVLPEEEFLEGLFGARYLEYKARVRRWL